MELIVSLDPEVMGVAARSLRISLTSTALAAVICLPLASVINFNSFRGKRLLLNVLQTFYSVPTVVVGLFVFSLFRRAGPFGGLGIMYTPTAMVIAQALLIVPILTGMTVAALRGVDPVLADTARSLGANRFQLAGTVMREARFGVVAAVVLAFGRAISEVGIAIIVGGNIRDFTRVLTSAISLETSRGDIPFAYALGIILLVVALVVSVSLNFLQQNEVSFGRYRGIRARTEERRARDTA